MSQVLIGIVGVILFIGLAIAGANYLGDGFMDAATAQRSAAIIARMSEVQSAVALRDANEINPLMSGTNLDQLIAEGYLKARPSNPGFYSNSSFANMEVQLLDSMSNVDGAAPAKYVAIPIGSDFYQHNPVCWEVGRRLGMNPYKTFSGGNWYAVRGYPGGFAHTQGCFRNGKAIGPLGTGYLFAFMPI